MKNIIFLLAILMTFVAQGQENKADTLKTLRVTLAMGGGVSLGSFSGSALTESLKLLVLYGVDQNGDPYKDVVVDGMSGASAGAMSLALMLRTLVDYKSVMNNLYNEHELNEKCYELGISDTFNIEEYIVHKIDSLYKIDIETFKEGRVKEKMIALQVAQDLQEKVWVEELSLKKLFGEKIDSNYIVGTDQTFGLLSTDFLKKIAKKYIIPKDSISFNEIQVLDKKRVTMAASLSNLSPIKAPKVQTHKNYKESPIVNNLFQSIASYNHKEVRVMDFVFCKKEALGVDATDSRWVELGASLTHEEEIFNKAFIIYHKSIGADYDTLLMNMQILIKLRTHSNNFSNEDLRTTLSMMINTLDDPDTLKRFPSSPQNGKDTFSLANQWEILATTVLACGAFPIAFEPVLLKRYSYEYADDEWPLVFQSPQAKILDIKTTFTDKIDTERTELITASAELITASAEEIAIKVIKEIAAKNKLDSLIANKKYHLNSFTDGNALLTYNSFNFAYVDGGTFNNEPITEANRIANFMDYIKKDTATIDTFFERLVLFVDPIVQENAPGFINSGFGAVSKRKEKKRKIKYDGMLELSKASGISSSLITMLIDQGSIKQDQIYNENEVNHKLKNELQAYLMKITEIVPNTTMTVAILEKITTFLKANQIPLGTRDPHRFLKTLMEGHQDSFTLLMANTLTLDALIDKALYYKKVRIDSTNKVTYVPNYCTTCPEVGSIDEKIKKSLNIKPLLSKQIAKLLLLGLVQVSLDAGDEAENTVLVGLTPFNTETKRIIRLPGSEIEAFTGFSSPLARKYAFEYGRLSSMHTLKDSTIRKHNNNHIDGEYHSFIPDSLIKDISDSLINSIKGLNYYINLKDNAKGIAREMTKQIKKRYKKLNKVSFTKRLGLSSVIRNPNPVVRPLPALFSYFTFKELKSGIKSGLLKKDLIPLTVRIDHENRSLKIWATHICLNDTTVRTTSKIIAFKEKVKKEKRKTLIEPKYRSYFKLYVHKYITNDTIVNIDFYTIPKVNIDTSEDPNFIKTPKLDESYKIENLVIKSWRKAKEEINLKALINRNNSSSYSLDILEYHINPMLYLDLNKNLSKDEKLEFSFKENTKPLRIGD